MSLPAWAAGQLSGLGPARRGGVRLRRTSGLGTGPGSHRTIRPPAGWAIAGWPTVLNVRGPAHAVRTDRQAEVAAAGRAAQESALPPPATTSSVPVAAAVMGAHLSCAGAWEDRRVNSGVERVVVVVSLVPALWAAVLVLRNKGIDMVLLIGAAVVEVAVLVQLVVGVVALVGSHHDISTVTFLGYLIGAVLIPPIGVAWGVGEKNRYGSAVLLVTFLVIAVMVLRLEQIWAGPSG